ncbi:uncharacterized protein HD556DRAFT_848810 [Suillus plorans]|uniref:Uncharacterized protein n=1 Tax=Suillus plorans TaxID=116603 RepID=A0A9P7DDQ9_9AGAM|nr:uncharacterized protein HD556DRAFT_848810 [Suillus plorans]KAG1788664.1 hypothetical protein HD556DRAFT_848810 [Suillus plorans]
MGISGFGRGCTLTFICCERCVCALHDFSATPDPGSLMRILRCQAIVLMVQKDWEVLGDFIMPHACMTCDGFQQVSIIFHCDTDRFNIIDIQTKTNELLITRQIIKY